MSKIALIAVLVIDKFQTCCGSILVKFIIMFIHSYKVSTFCKGEFVILFNEKSK